MAIELVIFSQQFYARMKKVLEGDKVIKACGG